MNIFLNHKENFEMHLEPTLDLSHTFQEPLKPSYYGKDDFSKMILALLKKKVGFKHCSNVFAFCQSIHYYSHSFIHLIIL